MKAEFNVLDMSSERPAYADDNLLPLSAVSDFAFCARRAALHRIEGVWQENRATAEGHVLHDHVHEKGSEARGDLRVARALRLRSRRLGLYGVADVVEFHRVHDDTGVALPGTRGKWLPFPVEYKRGIQRHEDSFEFQLCAQALCLEEMLSVCVPAGALFYGLSRRRRDVAFTQTLRLATEEAAQGLHALFEAGVTPPAEYDKRRCTKCSLFDICLPVRAGARKSARRYLENAIEETKIA